MPYITQKDRNELGVRNPQTAGELNYEITLLIDDYLKDKGGIRYTNLNEAIGALECAKMELYRRLAAPYEDKKRGENGEVYTVS